MMVMPLDFIYDHPGDLLARMAGILGGNGAKVLVVVDAIIVLCGAVLAAYVGVSSLLKTLATDSILPNFLSLTNSRNAAYMAIITFCTFSILLFILVFSPHNPTDIGSFGGVFAIAFLCVLLSFIYANILLKLYRQNLGRLVIAQWWEVFFCLGSILAALLGLLYLAFLPFPRTLMSFFAGNLILAPDVFSLFVIYLSGCLIVVILMFARVHLYSYSIWAVSMSSSPPVPFLALSSSS
jgi:amino acid transporter